MRIIIEIDNQSNQPSVQMQDSQDTALVNTVSAVNAIDAGAPSYLSNETDSNEISSDSSLNNPFNNMNSGGTSAGAAPTF